MCSVIVTNLYPGHFHYEPLRLSVEPAGYRLVCIARRPGGEPRYDGPAAAQFLFNYPMSRELVRLVLHRARAGQPIAVMMDDPLAFFDQNINRLIVPVLQEAARVFTSTDNMLPIYREIGVEAELLVGLANPLFDVPDPAPESEMEYDWGFIGQLVPQRFQFFWRLRRLVGERSHYIVTRGLGPAQVRERVRRTRCNIAYGNFSDICGFPSNATTLRAWEFPYAGGFVLHDERPLLHRCFVEGESVVTFRSVEECADLIRHYAAKPDERARIAAAARAVISQFPMKEFFPRLFAEMTSQA